MVNAVSDAVRTGQRRSAERSHSRLTPKDRADLRKGLLFISPWIIGVLAFTLFPLVYSIVISFTRYTGLNSPSWYGFQNYVRLFTDPLIGKAAINTGWYLLFAAPIGIVIALALAIAMNQRVREVSLYRTILYLPSLIPQFAMSFIFIVLFNPGYGMANKFLGLFGVAAHSYLDDPAGAKGVIIAMSQFTAGNAALIFLAGLNNIPDTLYEAARIDGASALTRFFKITLPLLSPVMLFNAINAVNTSLQIFAPAYVMGTGSGGPGAGGPDNGTLFYLVYLYQNAFSYAQLGYACAMAVLLFVVGILLAIGIFLLSRRYVHYGVES